MEQALTITTVEGVRGYMDANGTAQLNVEDIAYGLGFTQNKGGIDYPRYDRINAWLSDYDFPRRVGKGDYIPENMFYRLAMKASNEVAKKFQAKVADVILPAIRKTGMYINPHAPIDPRFLRRIADEIEQRDKTIAQQAETITLLQPKADYCEKVLESTEHLTSELIAKEYGEHAQWLHEKLSNLGKIYKRGRNWFMKKPYDKEGYRDSETVVLARGKTIVNHYWTQKGRMFIYNTLKKIKIVPLAEREEYMATLL